MPTTIIQSASWPGVTAVASCQYVCSHGISPGRAVLVTYPQFARPEQFGNLLFSDGVSGVAIRGCKVESFSPQSSSSGTIYTLDILDERWQWSGLGGISGHYNQKDDRGKLVPWTIRSPSELAGICFAALGIQRGTVDLPQGLAAASGADLQRYLKLGENFPQSITNPEVMWEHTPPAEALSQLADIYGCRVIYRPNLSRVDVVPLGSGTPFPNRPYESIGATVSAVPAPSSVGVFGPPVDIQARFLLEAVGREWDDSRIPINQLSYSPTGKLVPQIARVNEISPSGMIALCVRVIYKDKGGAPDTAVAVSSGGGTNTDKFAAVAAKLNANATFATAIKAVPDATGITLTGLIGGAFTLDVIDPSSGALLAWAFGKITQIGRLAEATWEKTIPPNFRDVQATNRLSYDEAVALAQETVFREYRILARDPHDLHNLDKPGRPLSLPWYGKIKRRQQILLLDRKVEQVQPAPRIPGIVNNKLAPLNLAGQGGLPEFYNGYSRSQRAVVYGSISHILSNVSWMFALSDPTSEIFNTPQESRVFVDFEINQKEQLVKFSRHIYKWIGGNGGSMVQAPILTLECAVNVLDPITSTPVRWEETLPIPSGFAPIEWKYREDLEVGVIGNYGQANTLNGFSYAFLADAKSRAGYYLRAQAVKYQVKGSEVRQYIGIVRHDPDAYCQQVIISVGDAGPTTILSGNTEWHPTTASYPSRRLAENLPPDKSAALANLKERELMMQSIPFEVKKDK